MSLYDHSDEAARPYRLRLYRVHRLESLVDSLSEPPDAGKLRKFQVGDAVRWTSQSGGYRSTKQGVVVAVVPPHIHPGDQCAAAKLSAPRNHESYVVSARQVGSARSKHRYWPLVAHLEACP
jgi:hypothetical protein